MSYKNPSELQNFSHHNTRPEPHDRLFRNETIENVIDNISEIIADDDIRRMFAQCGLETLPIKCGLT
jgi:hypothetical protein